MAIKDRLATGWNNLKGATASGWENLKFNAGVAWERVKTAASETKFMSPSAPTPSAASSTKSKKQESRAVKNARERVERKKREMERQDKYLNELETKLASKDPAVQAEINSSRQPGMLGAREIYGNGKWDTFREGGRKLEEQKLAELQKDLDNAIASESRSPLQKAWDATKNFFKGLVGFKTNTAQAENEMKEPANKSSTVPDVVQQTLKANTPASPADQQTAKSENAIHINDAKAGQLSVSVQQSNHPDAGKPGHLFGSSNPDHYTFREPGRADGVPGKIVNPVNKAQIIESIAEIETRSLKKTADEMGLQYKHQRGNDGSIHHQILNKDNKPLSSEQWTEFKAKSIDNFNKVSEEVCKDKPFSLTKMAERQPQQQRTYQSDQKQAAAQQQSTAQNTPTPPSPTQGFNP